MLQRRGVDGKGGLLACRSLESCVSIGVDDILAFVVFLLWVFVGDGRQETLTKMLALTAVLPVQSLIQRKPVSVHLRFCLVADV